MACGVAAWLYIRNHPHEHQSVNEQERNHIHESIKRAAENQGREDIRSILRIPSIWLLFIGWFCFNSLWYGFLTWIPSFLAKTQGLDIGALGWATFLVFFAGFAGELFGGQLLDFGLRTSASPETVYRRLFGTSAGLATIAVFLVAYVHDQAAVIALLAATLFFMRWCGMYWTLPTLLIGDRKAGFLAGAMNFAGNISGIVMPVTVGLIVSATGSYYLALMMFAAAGAGLFACSLAIRYRRVT